MRVNNKVKANTDQPAIAPLSNAVVIAARDDVEALDPTELIEPRPGDEVEMERLAARDKEAWDKCDRS